MKKLLSIVAIVMLIAAMTTVARSGDNFDLKKLISFQNGMWIAGVIDTSLTSSNEVNENEELNTASPAKKSSSMYFERETGDVWGISFIDEFRSSVKLPEMLFFVDMIKMQVTLDQRLVTYIQDTDVTGAATGLFGSGLNIWMIYRSVASIAMTFGNDIVKYTLGPSLQARIYFSQTGIDSFRAYPYLGNKFAFGKMLELQVNSEYMVRWYATAATANKPVDGSLNIDFRIGSPGLAGSGRWYLNAFAKRAVGYDLGPVTLGWFVRQRIDLDLSLNRWKDTVPGVTKDSEQTSTSYANTGLVKGYRFRTNAEVWVNPLRDMKLIGLNVGVTEFLDIQAAYAWNYATTIAFRTDTTVGAELILDKAVAIGAHFRVKTKDFANGGGVLMNGKPATATKAGAGDDSPTPVKLEWTNAESDITTAYFNKTKLIAHNTVPMGQGQMGPFISFTVVKNAFEWSFSYQGLAQFRNYDVSKNYIHSKYAPASETWWDWRNEVETYVLWKW